MEKIIIKNGIIVEGMNYQHGYLNIESLYLNNLDKVEIHTPTLPMLTPMGILAGNYNPVIFSAITDDVKLVATVCHVTEIHSNDRYVVLEYPIQVDIDGKEYEILRANLTDIPNSINNIEQGILWIIKNSKLIPK